MICSGSGIGIGIGHYDGVCRSECEDRFAVMVLVAVEKDGSVIAVVAFRRGGGRSPLCECPRFVQGCNLGNFNGFCRIGAACLVGDGEYIESNVEAVENEGVFT